MRTYVLIMLMAFSVSCATTPKEIPVPKVTRFDRNPKARSAYLESYRAGYQAPDEIGLCSWGDSHDEITIAGRAGRYDGQMAAKEARELERSSRPKERLR